LLVDLSITIQWGAIIGVSLFAALSDIRYKRIPNSLTFPLLVTGLLFSGLTGGLSGLGGAILACVLLGFPYILLFLFAGGGAGDAKLMGAIGTWLGVRQSAVVLLCAASAGIILALIKAIANRKLKFVLTNIYVSVYTFIIIVSGGKRPKVTKERLDSKEVDRLELPYGVAIFAGVCIAAAIVKIWGVDWLWQNF
jgi:prepilin peptidase CpaA